MNIAAQIDVLRAEIPGCRVVAFADLKTRLVLKASHQPDVRRETLDQLCIQAAQSFDLLSGEGVSIPEDAFALSPEDMRIFMRDAAGTSDLLCFVCGLESDPDQVVALGRKALTSMTVPS